MNNPTRHTQETISMESQRLELGGSYVPGERYWYRLNRAPSGSVKLLSEALAWTRSPTSRLRSMCIGSWSAEASISYSPLGSPAGILVLRAEGEVVV